MDARASRKRGMSYIVDHPPPGWPEKHPSLTSSRTDNWTANDQYSRRSANNEESSRQLFFKFLQFLQFKAQYDSRGESLVNSTAADYTPPNRSPGSSPPAAIHSNPIDSAEVLNGAAESQNGSRKAEQLANSQAVEDERQKIERSLQDEGGRCKFAGRVSEDSSRDEFVIDFENVIIPECEFFAAPARSLTAEDQPMNSTPECNLNSPLHSPSSAATEAAADRIQPTAATTTNAIQTNRSKTFTPMLSNTSRSRTAADRQKAILRTCSRNRKPSRWTKPNHKSTVCGRKSPAVRRRSNQARNPIAEVAGERPIEKLADDHPKLEPERQFESKGVRRKPMETDGRKKAKLKSDKLKLDIWTANETRAGLHPPARRT